MEKGFFIRFCRVAYFRFLSPFVRSIDRLVRNVSGRIRSSVVLLVRVTRAISTYEMYGSRNPGFPLHRLINLVGQDFPRMIVVELFPADGQDRPKTSQGGCERGAKQYQEC